MKRPQNSDEYSDKEATARFEAALKSALNTPPQAAEEKAEGEEGETEEEARCK